PHAQAPALEVVGFEGRRSAVGEPGHRLERVAPEGAVEPGGVNRRHGVEQLGLPVHDASRPAAAGDLPRRRATYQFERTPSSEPMTRWSAATRQTRVPSVGAGPMVRIARSSLLCGAASLILGGCGFFDDLTGRDPPSLILQTGPADETRESILDELTPTRDLLMQHADLEPNVVGPYSFHDRWPADIPQRFLSDLGRAIAECDRAAYDQARENWINQRYDPGHQGRSVSEAINDREREDLQNLIRVYNERP